MQGRPHTTLSGPYSANKDERIIPIRLGEKRICRDCRAGESYGTLPQNKIRQRSFFEVAAHMRCQSWRAPLLTGRKPQTVCSAKALPTKRRSNAQSPLELPVHCRSSSTSAVEALYKLSSGYSLQ